MQSHERGDCGQTLLFTKTAGNKVAEFFKVIPQKTAVQNSRFGFQSPIYISKYFRNVLVHCLGNPGLDSAPNLLIFA